MTRINKIVMSGFKSFAKHTEIQFGDGFNTVLGPNGSGKSNVIDALCFVLGRMSSKSMRAERLAHLIYNGGKTKQPASKGEVSLYFDNSKKEFPVSEAFLKITRMVKPNGQSVYRVNDERKTRQEVLDLMSRARIDPEGYNIILQGDIVRFVEMSSEERRKIIEEIAGISVYEDKKQKAVNELERVEARLREADILLTERKTHLKELKRDRDQALKYKALSDKVRQNKATYLDIQIRGNEKQKAAMDTEISETKAQIQKMQQEVEALKASVAEKNQSIEKIRNEIEEKGEQEQVSLNKEVEQARVEVETSKHRIKVVESELERLEARRLQLESDGQEIEKKKAALLEERKALQAAIGEKQKELAMVDKAISKFTDENQLANLAEIEARISGLDKSSDEKQLEIQAIVAKKQELLRERDRVEVELQSVDDRIKKVAEVEKENQSEVEKLKAKRQEFKKTLLELNTLLKEDSETAGQLGEARKRLLNAEEEFAKLRARSAGLRESAASNKAVASILNEKNNLKGIFGRVSELGSVSSEYSQALEAAAGPRLNSIVVDTDETAARAIRFLKEKKLGTATFIPLNKIRAKSEDENIKKFLDAKGVRGLAKALVSFDKKFSRVFSYVFGDTLVVDNIEVARRIGIGNARMATIEGDLCETSGAMHGGYRIRKAAAFQEDNLRRNVEENEAKVGQLREAVKVLENRKESLEEEIFKFKQRRSELEGDAIRIEKGLNLAAGDTGASEQQREELAKRLEAVSKSLEGTESALGKINKEFEKIKTERQELRVKISELRNPAALAELNAFRQKREELNLEITRVQGEIKNIALQADEILLQERQKITEALRQLEKDHKAFGGEKAELLKLIKKRDVDLKEMEKKASKFRADYRKLFDDRDRLREEVQKLDERMIRREEHVRQAEQRINNSSLKSAELAAVVAGLRQEFEEYSGVMLLQDKPEEELKEEIRKFERAAAEMGNVNLKALEVYEGVEKQYNELLEKKNTLDTEKVAVFNMINEIETRKTELFMNSFNVVSNNFSSIFNSLSTKGEAQLLIENPQNPFEGGVRIRVRLSGQKFLDIRSLSGGEKTMTALAFIFAIQENEPAPFYLLDEVDAALDKKNSKKLAELISKYSQNAQYIVISHNDAVVSESNVLYGISMDEHGMSNVVSLKV